MVNAKNFCQLLSIFTCLFVLVICENKKLEDMKRLILLLCLSVVIGAVHAQTGRLDSSACPMWIILIRSRQQQARMWKSDSPPRCPIRMTLRWASGWRGREIFSVLSPMLEGLNRIENMPIPSGSVHAYIRDTPERRSLERPFVVMCELSIGLYPFS